nr:MAG TPA: hypothetical protein [Caudoviricetes sp.]DAS72988.1 MAG TPA: hypothetical protein [Caudoviricetes sp.]
MLFYFLILNDLTVYFKIISQSSLNYGSNMLYFICNKSRIPKFNGLKKHYLIATKGNAFFIA